MARKRIGIKVANVTCPICNTMYLITGDEFNYIDSDNEEDVRGYFYCDECDRSVIVDTNNSLAFKVENLIGRDEKWFWSNK